MSQESGLEHTTTSNELDAAFVPPEFVQYRIAQAVSQLRTGVVIDSHGNVSQLIGRGLAPTLLWGGIGRQGSHKVPWQA